MKDGRRDGRYAKIERGLRSRREVGSWQKEQLQKEQEVGRKKMEQNRGTKEKDRTEEFHRVMDKMMQTIEKMERENVKNVDDDVKWRYKA